MKLKHKIKMFIVNSIPDSIKSTIVRDFKNGSASYSQEGEDILLERHFDEKKNGFFIDVGAHHPTRFSNTYRLYLNGWRGLNIDAMPGCMDAFNKIRPEDTNLEVPISDIEETLVFYVFNEPALNTFSKEEAESKAKIYPFYIKDKLALKTERLDSILEKHKISDKVIDLLSVDAEGLDLKVLKSNDWSKFRPEIVVVEGLNNDFNEIFNSEVFFFMKENGYKLISKLANSQFYKKIY